MRVSNWVAHLSTRRRGEAAEEQHNSKQPLLHTTSPEFPLYEEYRQHHVDDTAVASAPE